MRGIFVFLFIFGFITSAGGQAEAKAAPFSNVSSKVSQAFCGKMDQCSPEAMSQKDCLSEMKGTLQDSYNKLPKDKKLEVPEEDLTLCLKNIKGASCEDIKSAQTLKGCEFLQMLPPG